MTLCHTISFLYKSFRPPFSKGGNQKIANPPSMTPPFPFLKGTQIHFPLMLLYIPITRHKRSPPLQQGRGGLCLFKVYLSLRYLVL